MAKKTVDPTRTKTIRARFEADLVRRFKKVRQDVIASLVPNDALGLKTNAPMPRGQFVFATDPTKHEAFMVWLQEQVDSEILMVTGRGSTGRIARRTPWTDIYIQSAYQRGVLRGRQELRKQGVQVASFGGVSSLGEGGGIGAAFNQPYNVQRMGLAFTRTFTELKGITEAMSQAISRELAQGLAEGRNPRVIARNIANRIDKIGITRARTLARTEVVRAHHAANIEEYKAAGIDEVEIIAEWVTAGDSRVCSRCANMAGRRFKLDVIEGLIPLHPNCRCVAIPIVGEEGAKQKRRQTPSEVRRRAGLS